ncbi:HpcH/HpaI aldolase family protein [Duganella radicis]|uniref:2-keto-3-deoxy-L-rhamnonate aldolase n=1 Tax=Duganella radicis TaxID=551988 RepID=A0A6L6PAV0_9BURK|nr:HpcH/HpaI aldolase/citrate lyase family protein [Duganella radicis]MTV36020.1 2-keto-3-deoxy-L-rhamnonate aldolase [Duganella radicis]
MEIPRNGFKRALLNGDRQVGLFLGTASPYIADMVAGAGFDWLLIDGEHGPNDLHTILVQLQVLAAYPVRPVVRVLDHDPARIKQLLDVGAQSLMAPMVENAQQAQALVRAMRYPPQGMRGVGTAMARAAHWNAVGDYFTEVERELCLLVQIESVTGLKALEEIAAVPGVDGVFIGPSDLAASMGHLGNPGHPDVKAAVADAIARVTAAGKAAGVFSADPAVAAAYGELGARFLLVGVDTLLLRQAAAALAARFTNGAGATGAAY